MNPSPFTKLKSTPRRSHWLHGAFAALALTSLSTAAMGQVEYINETLRDGALPVGWSATDVSFTTAADGYANMTGTTAVLTTPIFDASGHSSVRVDFSVAKFGTGDNGPVRVEFSVDGGEDWFIAGSSETPTSNTYINDSITISVSSATFMVRFTTVGSPSNKRLRDVVISDGIEPVVPFDVVSLTPASGAADVPLNTELTLTFNRPPSAGTGSVTLRQSPSVTEVFSASAGDFDGNSVTFTPSAPLNELENYFVLVSSDAFVDSEGEPFAGYSIGIEWAFVSQEAAIKMPEPISSSPENGTSIFMTDLSSTPLIVTFDEPISLVGSGFIWTDPVEIRRVSDDFVVEEIPVSGDFYAASVDGAVLTLSSFASLEYDTEYYVFIPAGTVENSAETANGDFGAPSSDFPWTFTVRSFALLEDEVPYEEGFNNFDGDNLAIGWSANSSGGVNAYQGDWGSGNAGGFRGGVSDPGALGYQHNASSGILTVAINIRNDTGGTIDELYVSYLGRVARATQGRSPEWTVKLNGVEVTELFYSTLGAVDETKAHWITGLDISDGEVFTLSWESDRGEPEDGSRQIGIADVFVGLEEPVAPPADDFASWIALFDVGGLTGPFDAPAGDGVPNILKHILGLAPGVAVTGSLVTTSDAGPGTITFVHTRIKPGALASDALADYEWSTNLADWALDGDPIGGVTVEFGPQTVLDDSHPDFDLVQVTATVTDGAVDRLFIRILADIDAGME